MNETYANEKFLNSMLFFSNYYLSDILTRWLNVYSLRMSGCGSGSDCVSLSVQPRVSVCLVYATLFVIYYIEIQSNRIIG